MDQLQQELDRLLDELAELDRLSETGTPDDANQSLMTISRRGTKIAIAEVRGLMAQMTAAH